MNTFFTADWHLGENRFEIMGRPFSTPDEMIETLIKNHNEMVKPEDLVYVVGDVCYKQQPQYLIHVERFNGRKILLRGNHDEVFSDEDLAPYFEKIYAEGEGLQLNVNRVDCNVVHYPSLAKPDLFNLVGHIHSGWKVQLNSLNVGVDVHHFRPVDAEKIPFHFKAITEFYDQDMWAAYNNSNMHWKNVRGQQSSYFKTL